MKVSKTTFLLHYIKKKQMSLLFYLLFCSLCLLICLLSQISTRPFLYAFFVCSFLGMIAFILSYRKEYKRYEALIYTCVNQHISLNSFPEADDLMEVAYQELAHCISSERMHLYTQMQEQLKDSNDYYTLWMHQIKTPIFALRLLLISKDIASKQLLMEQELFRIEQYAQMALTYLRIPNLSSDLQLETCELHALVRDSIKKFSSSFIEKGLILDFEDFNISLVTDKKWISFLIEQFLSNSIKYTKTGTISVFCSHKEETNAFLLHIKDTGIGIKQEDLPRIFEKGFTGYNGHMDKRSTGIGLYLCKQVAPALGITITVDSNLGKGTCITLQFPQTLQK